LAENSYVLISALPYFLTTELLASRAWEPRKSV